MDENCDRRLHREPIGGQEGAVGAYAHCNAGPRLPVGARGMLRTAQVEAVEGHVVSFAEVYRTHFGAVCTWARALGHSADGAHDIAQETFLVVHRRFQDIDPNAPIRPWLFGITRRVSATARRGGRRRDRREKTAPSVHATRSVSPEDWFAAQEKLSLVDRFLDQLPERYRVVFVLVELDGQTSPEVSATLGVPLPLVRTRLRTARRRFEKFVLETPAGHVGETMGGTGA